MADPTNKHKEYALYAQHCLHMVTMARDQESRSIQREMAAEWLRLADTVAQAKACGTPHEPAGDT